MDELRTKQKLNFSQCTLSVPEDGEQAAGEEVEELETANDYHDDIRIMPAEGPMWKPRPCNPLKKGYAPETIKTFLEDALKTDENEQRPLAGVYIDDDGYWNIRIGVSDVGYLHQLRDKVLRSKELRMKEDKGTVRRAMEMMLRKHKPTLPPSPPPSPPSLSRSPSPTPSPPQDSQLMGMDCRREPRPKGL